MSQTRKKQTARKTTGKHVLLSSALSPAPSPSLRQAKKRVQHRTPTKSPLKSILKRSSVAVVPPPALPAPTTSVASKHDDVGISDDPEPEPASLPPHAPPPAGATVTKPARPPRATRRSEPGSLVTWRPPAPHVLDKPISVCMRFATWLENEKCVHEEALMRAVERDGRPFLSLAKATVVFDNALRGHGAHTVNGDTTGPFGEHARTLRVFAELLKSKISEGSLSTELEAAVLRDGEPLLRLAVCCLEFDQAVRGSDGTTGS